jgi:initiation factor 1A
MPNRTGGKNYKKSKQTGTVVKPFIDRQSDQMYARILRNLGGRNMLVYCNDNKIRLCHICGAMKKFSWLQVGDMVLISLRDFEKTDTDKYPKGDILAKYDSDHYSMLKKLPDINQKLFLQLETMDGTILAQIGSKEESKVKLPGEEEDTGIEFDRSGDAEDEEDHSEKEIDIDDI